MDDKYAKERAEIIDLSAKDDEASTELLNGYIREAMSSSILHLNQPFLTFVSRVKSRLFRNLQISPGKCFH